MRKRIQWKKGVVLCALAGAVMVGGLIANPGLRMNSNAESEPVNNHTKIVSEITESRSKFTKLFAMEDGSYTSISYSMPTHYLKDGKWKEIDTTLVKSGKNYRTKATELSIRVAKKANKKNVISMKRGNFQLTMAPFAKKIKASAVKIVNPKKNSETDVLTANQVTYKNIMKNIDVSYDIYPEKIQEIIHVNKKTKRKEIQDKDKC